VRSWPETDLILNNILQGPGVAKKCEKNSCLPVLWSSAEASFPGDVVAQLRMSYLSRICGGLVG
jgi:hypothetical protein